ncbi:hypothetical protein FHS39_002563 [Streptomyces olivoverticillatus]|uniref:Uncharacterized protein n=1 Tax=Streptomyces olivoverticillatus TaxID=66427 RepID=A0A7W7LNX3_9ACTN|nr:hypothetical protein [Streptomyces olivoverticillatus]MBB4893532.1 hypothetical protein [Streptomyces olivoverticillatus]
MPEPVAQQPQGTHFFLITLDVPGRMQFTSHGTYNPPEGVTRQDAYLAIRQHVVESRPEFQQANVAFFAFDRNEV